jgi:hypothetical protein
MASLGSEPRGEVVIAPRSTRPANVHTVTQEIILPALLEQLLSPTSKEPRP